MRPTEENTAELTAVMEQFAEYLEKIHARTALEHAQTVARERALIEEIRSLTTAPVFLRACRFTGKNALEQALMSENLEIGHCEDKLKRMREQIQRTIALQKEHEKAQIDEIKRAFPNNEFKVYAHLFLSDVFLNYYLSNNK